MPVLSYKTDGVLQRRECSVEISVVVSLRRLHQSEPLAVLTGVRTRQLVGYYKELRRSQRVHNAVLGLLCVGAMAELAEPIIERLGLSVARARHRLLSLDDVIPP